MGKLKRLKVIIRLQGGLGNQMFQYATTRALSEARVSFDMSFLNYHKISSGLITARAFELGIFPSLYLKKFNFYYLKLLLTKRLKTLKFFLPNSLKKIAFITDSNIENYSVQNQANIQLFQGDFQNPNLFSKFRTNLLKEFTFPDTPHAVKKIEAYIFQTNSVSIHVRRGDYLKPELTDIHGLLSLDYYNKAISKVMEEIKEPVFFIFSDDIEWCRQNLKPESVEVNFISNSKTPAWVDMYLMSICKHNIIANSTFSWWAAWLNQHTEKIVISPSEWFANSTLNEGVKLILPSWSKI